MTLDLKTHYPHPTAYHIHLLLFRVFKKGVKEELHRCNEVDDNIRCEVTNIMFIFLQGAWLVGGLEI